jgi:hypothetical protein
VRKFAAVGMLAAGLQIGLGAAAADTVTAAAAPPAIAVAATSPVAFTPIHFDEIGAEVVSIGLSGDDTLIDVRYRVLDAAKADALLDGKVHPVLIRKTDGSRYYVPTPPKVGAMRQTRRNNKPIEVGRVYFMLFANPGRQVHDGDLIALEIGAKRVDDLKVGK